MNGRDYTPTELALNQALLGCCRPEISETELTYTRARLMFWQAQIDAELAKRDQERARKQEALAERMPECPECGCRTHVSEYPEGWLCAWCEVSFFR